MTRDRLQPNEILEWVLVVGLGYVPATGLIITWMDAQSRRRALAGDSRAMEYRALNDRLRQRDLREMEQMKNWGLINHVRLEDHEALRIVWADDKPAAFAAIVAERNGQGGNLQEAYGRERVSHDGSGED